MVDPNISLYRENALKHYREGRDRDVLPRLVAPSAFLLLWLLLGVLVLFGLLAWSLQIPVYATGSGVLMGGDQPDQVRAVIFLPAQHLSSLHPGQRVQLSIGSAHVNEQAPIVSIEPGLLSPQAASQRYGLGSEAGLLVQQPSVAVIVKLDPQLAPGLSAGTLVQAKIQIGSQPLLALLSLFGSSIGG